MIIHFDESGKITRQVSFHDEIGDRFLSCDIDGFLDDTKFFVDIESLEIKSRIDYLLDNLPLPCIIQIENTCYEVSEQPIFEFDTPGTYIIKVFPNSVEYLEKEFEYVVEA